MMSLSLTHACVDRKEKKEMKMFSVVPLEQMPIPKCSFVSLAFICLNVEIPSQTETNRKKEVREKSSFVNYKMFLPRSTVEWVALVCGLFVVSVCGSSSGGDDSSSSEEDPTVSNIAAAAGACIGIVFLLCFYIFLERRYPNAAVGFR